MLVGTCIWIPYFLASARVRNTFRLRPVENAIPTQYRDPGAPSVQVGGFAETSAVPFLKAWLVFSFLVYGVTAAIYLFGLAAAIANKPTTAAAIEGVLLIAGMDAVVIAKIVCLRSVWRLRKWGAIGSMLVTGLLLLGGLAWEITLQVAMGESQLMSLWVFVIEAFVFWLIVRPPNWSKFT
jgi:hypothetical protein